MNKINFPWYSEYKILGIPKTLKPYPKKPVYDMLIQAAKKYKNMGCIQMNYLITYPEILDHVNRLATALQGMGLQKGDRVASMLPTSIQFVITDYAISRAGLVHIPTSSLEPPEQLIHKFKEGAPKVIICIDEYMDLLSNVISKAKIENVIISKLKDYSNDVPSDYKDIKIKGAECLWLKDIIKNTAPSPRDVAFDIENDIETLLFTGGTTGLPKGCMLTHKNIYSNVIQAKHSQGIAAALIEGACTALIGVPFFHSYGHNIMHTMTLRGFNQILVNDARDTKGMVQMIKEFRPFIQIGVPTQFMKLAEEDLEDIFMLGVSGSAPLPPTTQDKLEKKSGSAGIMEGYGLSEMSPTTHLNTSFLMRAGGGRKMTRIQTVYYSIPGNKQLINFIFRKLGSKRVGKLIGKLYSMRAKSTGEKEKDVSAEKRTEKRGTIGVPFPDTDIKVVDISTGKELTWEEIVQGKTGEMLLSGPQRMLGYWPKPGSGVDDEGYIHTSDVVRVDERGYFYIVDRTKDMIIVSGYKVYSRELDDILHDYKGIELAATVGIPDPDREGSERVVVYVQPAAGYKKKLKESEIIDYLRTKVAKYAVPKAIKIIDTIPLTEVQKVNKKELREMAKKDFAGQLSSGKKSAPKKAEKKTAAKSAKKPTAKKTTKKAAPKKTKKK